VSLNRFHIVVIAGWFAAIIAVIGVRLEMGAPVTLAQSVALLMLGCIPAAVLVLVFRGAPPPTIGQVLYETDQAAGPTTRRVPLQSNEFGR
jgi:hypothetical protein